MSKTPQHVAYIDISDIVNEVKKHGFYSSYCDDFIHGASNHNELILMIKMLARSVNLKVSFNVTESICVFEALID
jgi:hypothetical protein